MSRPLHGVRVLDLSRLLPGPMCTWYLRGQGAQVDVVEPPKGEPARAVGVQVGEHRSLFGSLWAGKRSMVMNLRHPGAADALYALMAHYDVLVEGFRPGTLEAIGVDPLRLVQEGKVVTRISGFGQQGRWARRPGHDLNFMGVAGLLERPGGEPVQPLVQVADVMAGLTAAMGTCSALVAQGRRGEGRVVDCSLAESVLPLIAPWLPGWSEGRTTAGPFGGDLATYRLYRCADDTWLAVGAVEPHFGRRSGEVLGVDPGDVGQMTTAFAAHPRAHWLEALRGTCVSAVIAPHEVAQVPAHADREAVQWRDGALYVRPPLGELGGRAPRLGEHTVAILEEAGHAAWIDGDGGAQLFPGALPAA